MDSIYPLISKSILGNAIGGDLNGITISIKKNDFKCTIGTNSYPYPAFFHTWDNVIDSTIIQWNHFILTCQILDSVAEYCLYVNGVNFGCFPQIHNHSAGNSFYSMKYGINKTSPTINPFSGKLDEMAFWNRPLNIEEIEALYNNGDGFQYPFNSGCDSILEFTNTNILYGDLVNILTADGINQNLIENFNGNFAYRIEINGGGGFQTHTEMKLCLDGILPVSGIAMGLSDDTASYRTQIGIDPTLSNLFKFNNLGWVDVSSYANSDELFFILDSKWGTNIDTYIYYWLGTLEPINPMMYSLLDDYLDDFGYIQIDGYEIFDAPTANCDSIYQISVQNITLNSLDSLLFDEGISDTLAGEYIYKISINGGGGSNSLTQMKLCLSPGQPLKTIARGISDTNDPENTQIGKDSTFTNLFAFNNMGWVDVSQHCDSSDLYLVLDSKLGEEIDTYIDLWFATDILINPFGYGFADLNLDDFGFIEIACYKVIPNTPSICMVTVDSITNKNMIIWEPDSDTSIAFYSILKETTITNFYEVIGQVNSNNNCIFIDTSSYPTQSASRYKISATSTNGTESFASTAHKTIHLIVNQDPNGNVNLIWDDYEGFEFFSYYIYRGFTPGNLTAIDSIQSTLHSYVDFDQPTDTTLFYLIGVKPSDPCNPYQSVNKDEPYNTSVSNMEQYGPQPGGFFDVDNKYGLRIFPNPFNDQLFVSFNFVGKTDMLIYIYNSKGQLIYHESATDDCFGKTIRILNIETDLKGTRGLYYINVLINGDSYSLKAVKN